MHAVKLRLINCYADNYREKGFLNFSCMLKNIKPQKNKALLVKVSPIVYRATFSNRLVS